MDPSGYIKLERREGKRGRRTRRRGETQRGGQGPQGERRCSRRKSAGVQHQLLAGVDHHPLTGPVVT